MQISIRGAGCSVCLRSKITCSQTDTDMLSTTQISLDRTQLTKLDISLLTCTKADCTDLISLQTERKRDSYHWCSPDSAPILFCRAMALYLGKSALGEPTIRIPKRLFLQELSLLFPIDLILHPHFKDAVASILKNKPDWHLEGDYSWIDRPNSTPSQQQRFMDVQLLYQRDVSIKYQREGSTPEDQPGVAVEHWRNLPGSVLQVLVHMRPIPCRSDPVDQIICSSNLSLHCPPSSDLLAQLYEHALYCLLYDYASMRFAQVKRAVTHPRGATCCCCGDEP